MAADDLQHVISSIGVLVAFPMKRRFINEDQLPFPEGRTAGVVLDALYSGEAAAGMLRAKLLAVTALLTGVYQFVSSDGWMRLVQFTILRMDRWAGLAEPVHWRERFGPEDLRDPEVHWWGVTMMVVGALVGLFARPEIFTKAFAALTTKKEPTTAAIADPLCHIELPLWLSFAGIPILSIAGAMITHQFFGVSWLFALISLPLDLLVAGSKGPCAGHTCPRDLGGGL